MRCVSINPESPLREGRLYYKLHIYLFAVLVDDSQQQLGKLLALGLGCGVLVQRGYQ